MNISFAGSLRFIFTIATTMKRYYIIFIFITTVTGLFGVDYLTEFDLTINLKSKVNVSVWFKYEDAMDRITAAAFYENTPYDKHYFKIPLNKLSKRSWIQMDFQRGVNNDSFSISVEGIPNAWQPTKEDHPSNFIKLIVNGKIDLCYQQPCYGSNNNPAAVVIAIILILLFLIGTGYFFYKKFCY